MGLQNSGPRPTLHYTRCAVPTPVAIAAQLGWLETESLAESGVELASLLESENEGLRESHYDHALDSIVRFGGSVPALWARARGADTRLIGVSWVDEFQGIVSLPGRGVSTAADLRGRRVGVPAHGGDWIDVGRATALRGITAALELGGVSRADVEFVDVRTERTSIAEQGATALANSRFTLPRRKSESAAVLALARGDVDAIYLKGPKGLQLVHLLGAHVVVDLGSHPDPRVRVNNCTPRPLTVSAALLERAPEAVARFLARLIDAGAWAQTHANEAVALLARETGGSEAWVRHAYGHDVHRSLGIDLGAQSLDALQSLARFLFDERLIPAHFEIDAWVDREPLAAATAIAGRSGRRVA